jgi:hypothetical protein
LTLSAEVLPPILLKARLEPRPLHAGAHGIRSRSRRLEVCVHRAAARRLCSIECLSDAARVPTPDVDGFTAKRPPDVLDLGSGCV